MLKTINMKMEKLFDIAFLMMIGSGTIGDKNFYKSLSENSFFIRENELKFYPETDFSYECAKGILEELHSGFPEDKLILLALAISKDWIRYYDYWQIGNQDEILELLSKAISIDPHYPELYLRRARAFSHKKMYIESINDYLKAVEIDQNEDDSYLKIADIYCIYLKDYLRTMESISIMIEKYPKNPKYFSMRGNFNRIFKKYANSIVDYTTAINLGKEGEDGYYYDYFNRSLIKDLLGDYVGAWEDFQFYSNHTSTIDNFARTFETELKAKMGKT